MSRVEVWNRAQEAFHRVDLGLGLPLGTVEARVQRDFKVPIEGLCTKGMALDHDRRYWAPERMREDWHEGCAAVYRTALTAIGHILGEHVDKGIMTDAEAMAFSQTDVGNIFRPLVESIDAIV